MRKTIFYLLIVVVVLSMTFMGISCQTAPAAETVAEPAATEAPATEAPAAADEPAADDPAAAEFNWRQFEGTEIKILGVAGPYNPEIQEAIAPFEEMTGIKVSLLDFIPEADYYNKVQLVAAAGQGEYDIFMVGFPNMIDWVPANWLEPLEGYLNDSSLTNPDIDMDDFFPSILDNCYWDGVNGSPFGKTENASLYALPLGCMINVLMYRKDIFEKHDLTPPKTIQEAIEVGEIIQDKEPGMYGLAMRGSKEVATLYGGIWQTLMTYGATDFDKDLNPQFNSPEMVNGLEEVSEMINKIGNVSNWANVTWFEVMTDLASGSAAMAIDAVPMIAWINADPSDLPGKGNLAYAPPIYGTTPDNMVSSLWAWNLGMSSASKNKEAAWLFMQWVTGKEMQAEGTVMAFPTRSSVFDAPDFIEANEMNFGFFETWEATVPYAGFIFTPAIGLNDYGYEFVGAIQDAVLGTTDAQSAMDRVVKYYNDNF
jgi:multiple sugar transport system substrate-binding protein